MSALEPVLAAMIRTATPLLLAGLGELVTERAGVINIGLEGAVICGALAATVAAPPLGVAGGYLSALVAGAAVGVLMATFVVVLRADQIISGTAVALLGLGLTGALYHDIYGAGGVALTVPTSRSFDIPVLSGVPVLGPALFQQPLMSYMAFLLAPALAWFLYRTHAGLSLRAVGEAPHAARAAGVAVDRFRVGAIIFGSALGGAAGGVLVLAQSGTFAEGMSAGRGFIAIAIVALGRWTPTGVLVASLVFGFATAMQYVVQALGWPLRYELVLTLPYVLTLVALVLAPRGAAPAYLARTD